MGSASWATGTKVHDKLSLITLIFAYTGISYTVYVYIQLGSFYIEDNKTTHFYGNYFLADSECPQTEDPQTNS